MPTTSEAMLRAYADLTVKIGLNIQPHQRLLIIGPITNGGAALEAAPFVREIAAAASWAARVFPDADPCDGVNRLWDAIARLCRLDSPDPIAAWETHLRDLAARTERLNRKRYSALRYTGPGTSLTIGLPPGHVWVGGRSTNAAGIVFAPNLPTEEVFTMPHKDQVDGVVRSTKPLSYGGTLIENFTLRFE